MTQHFEVFESKVAEFEYIFPIHHQVGIYNIAIYPSDGLKISNELCGSSSQTPENIPKNTPKNV